MPRVYVKKNRKCSIEGCGKRHEARGWCPMHYARWKVWGDPLHPGIKPNTPYGEPLAWLQNAIATYSPDQCWLWPYGMNKGYGDLTHEGEHLAHRVAYQLVKGPIPEGLSLDHLCHNLDHNCTVAKNCPHRRCVNPAHLEPVTSQVNTARGNTGRYPRPDICKWGHSLTDPANVYWDGPYRKCMTCRRAQWTIQAAKRKAARHAAKAR